MAYLGRGIENLSDRVVLDSLTASATASYTLQLNSVNFVPSSASSLTVSLNGVIQKPESSYTVSGSTLTFSSALTSSDSIDFIIAERGITLQTPSAGSVGTSQLASTAVTTAKIADDAVTKDKVSNLMYPAFEANRATDLTLTDNTTQKMTYDTEIFDTDNCYDATTNYRFTPTVGGKYYVYASLNVQASTATTLNLIFLEIHKNGTKYRGTINNMNANFTTGLTPYVGTVIDMNGTTDYVEVYIRPAVNSGTVKSDNADNVFGAYRIGD